MGDYEVELGKAKVVKEGNNVTIVAWGNQVNVVAKVRSFDNTYTTMIIVNLCVSDFSWLVVLLVWDDCVQNYSQLRLYSFVAPTLTPLCLPHHHHTQAVEEAEKLGISCEVIDLRTLLPWDEETVLQSVSKTGRLVLTHEAPVSTPPIIFLFALVLLMLLVALGCVFPTK